MPITELHSRLEVSEADSLRNMRGWIAQPLSEEQIDGIGKVLARRELGEPISPDLQRYENLHQSLRRRSFC